MKTQAEHDAYWDNRKAGRRGQGGLPNLAVNLTGGRGIYLGIKRFKRENPIMKGATIREVKKHLWDKVKETVNGKANR